MTEKMYFIFNDSSVWSQSLLAIKETKIAGAVNANETYEEVTVEELQSLQDTLGEGLGIENNVVLIDGTLTARPSKFHTYDSVTNTLVDGSDAEKTADVLQEVRELRASYLAETDWTQMPDCPLTDAKKTEWRTYRSALRDLPQMYSSATDKAEIVWPTKPS